jgi:NAD(P)-dependent dehydrogenase (short-subunit alcohol dehydrogenase family)
MERVVLITGCSTGFGRVTAETLAREKYQVFAAMRNAGGRNAGNARELQALAERESLAIAPYRTRCKRRCLRRPRGG